MTHIRRFLIIGSIALLFVGCTSQSGSDSQKDSNQFLKLNTTQSINQHESNDAKDLVSQHEEVTTIHAINGSKDLIIAFEVHHHDRFQLKKIKKMIQKEIDKAFPKLKTTVSTDKKIILELRKLEKKVNEGSISKKEINKEIKELTTLAKEQT